MNQPPRHTDPGGAPGGPLPFGGPSFIPGSPYGGEVVLFDPSNDSSPYAAKHKKKKGRAGAKPPVKASARAKAAERVYGQHDPYEAGFSVIPGGLSSAPAGARQPGAHAAAAPGAHAAVPGAAAPDPFADRPLRLVTDDPNEIRRYAEEQVRSDASRTMAGFAPVPAAPAYRPAPADLPDESPYAARPQRQAPRPAPATVDLEDATLFAQPPARGRVAGAAPQPAAAGLPYEAEAPAWSSYEIDDDPAHPRPSARRRGAGTGRIAAGPAPSPATPGDRPQQQPADAPAPAEDPEGPGREEGPAAPGADGEGDGKPQARGRRVRVDPDAQPQPAAGSRKRRRAVRKARKAREKAAKRERRQQAAGAPRSEAGTGPARAVRRRLDAEALWRRSMVCVTVALAVCVTVGMLYFPAQEVYLNMRENERLTDELDQNLARNSQMQDRVETLQTAEGVQDEARRVYGLVMPGDNAISVVGVDYEAPSNAVPAEIPRGSGSTTDTWATDLLDRVFGVTDLGASTAEATDVATVTEQGADGDGAAVDPGADIVAQGDGPAGA